MMIEDCSCVHDAILINLAKPGRVSKQPHVTSRSCACRQSRVLP